MLILIDILQHFSNDGTEIFHVQTLVSAVPYSSLPSNFATLITLVALSFVMSPNCIAIDVIVLVRAAGILEKRCQELVQVDG